MSPVTGILILFVISIGVFYKLISIALRRKANVRAGARLGPGSFFFEITDRKPDSLKSQPKK